MMLNSEDLKFSFKGVSVEACQSVMFRLGNRNCFNSAIQCPICLKLHTFDKCPGLKTTKCQYSFIICWQIINEY